MIGADRAVTVHGNGAAHGAPRPAPLADAARQDMADYTPPWLRYLAAAYPTGKPSAATMAVMEDQFAGEEPAIMMAVAKRWVRASVWWPQPAELWQMVGEERGARLDRPLTDDERAQRHERHMAHLRAAIAYSDDDLLAYEAQAGRIEPAPAPAWTPAQLAQLESIRAAYARTMDAYRTGPEAIIA